MHIGTRLKEERERLSLSQTELADRAGVTRKTQFNYEGGERQPDAAYLVAVAGAGVDVNYVLFGKKLPAAMVYERAPAGPPGRTLEVQEPRSIAPMLQGVTAPALLAEMRVALSSAVLPLALGLSSAQGESREYRVIPKLQGSAAAGRSANGGAMGEQAVVDLGGEMAFSPHWIERYIGVKHGLLVSIEVTGDSMAPTVQDGDTVIIDTGERRITVSGVYVIAPQGRYQLKRIHLKLDGSVRVMSDNTAYEPEDVPAHQVGALNVVGRMVWPRLR